MKTFPCSISNGSHKDYKVKTNKNYLGTLWAKNTYDFYLGDPTTPTNLPHQAEDLFTGECNIVDIDCSWTNTPATNCTCLVTIDETGHTESYGMEVKIDRIVLHHLPGQGPSDYSDTLTAVVTLSDSRGLQFYYGSEGQACITSEGSCRPEKKLYGNYLIS